MRFILPVMVFVLLSGCLGGQQIQKFADAIGGTTSTTSTTLKKVMNPQATTTTLPDIKTVGEALFMWVPYECNFTNQLTLSDHVKTEIWMSEGKYHAIITHGRFTNHVINDGVNAFIWGDEEHGGMRYKISEITGLREHIESSEVKANRSVAIPTEYIDLISAKNVTCSRTALPEGIFDPPARPSFTQGRGTYDYAYDSKLDKYGKNGTI